MVHKYGIYQSTSTSCIFYKQDRDGNQSTFNLFIAPKDESEEGEKIFAFVDNEQLQQKNWFGTNKELSIEEVVKAFGGWATDAPLVFEMEATKHLGNCLGSKIKNSENK